VSPELAGIHAIPYLAATGAKRRVSLDQVIDQIVIEREQRKTVPTLGFEKDSIGRG
jgi:hypothetical protein